MKKKLIVVLLIIMLFNMLYIQPVYAQTSLIESIKQKASELALIKLAVATGVSAVTTYHTAKGFVQDMVNSAPDIFNEFKDSVVDSTNKLKFALVASDTVWQGTKAFVSSLNKPIETPIEYIPRSVEVRSTVSGLPITVESGEPINRGGSYEGHYKIPYKLYFNNILAYESETSFSTKNEGAYITLSSTGLELLVNAIQNNKSFNRDVFPLEIVRPLIGEIYPITTPGRQLKLIYDPASGILSYGTQQVQITEPVISTNEYYLDGYVYSPDGTITLDPRSIDPDDDFVNDKVGDTPKRLVGFPLPWSELPSVSEGVINDGIDLGELSNAQLEAIDLTLDALLEQVDSLSTDLVRTEDLLKEALLNPPIDTTGVIPAIESIGNIIVNAFNPPTISLDFSPLQNFNILTNKFPFSLPWDLKNTFQVLLDTPEPPIFNIPFKFGGILENVELDFTLFDPIIGLFRWLLIIAFTLGLIYLSTIYL